MKKMTTFLSLMLVSSTVFAGSAMTDSEFDAALKRGLTLGDIILSCNSQNMSATREKCLVALDEAVKLEITPSEVAEALNFKKTNSEDKIFEAKLKKALDQADSSLIEKRNELLKSLEYNK